MSPSSQSRHGGKGPCDCLHISHSCLKHRKYVVITEGEKSVRQEWGKRERYKIPIQLESVKVFKEEVVSPRREKELLSIRDLNKDPNV